MGSAGSNIVWAAPFSGDVFVRCVRPPDLHEYASYDLTITGTVADLTPPQITVQLSRNVLWPPNHSLSEIQAAVIVSDDTDPNPVFVLTSIVSNELDNGQGDGDTDNDIQDAALGTPDIQFQLRSERSALGDGRKYTITYTAGDASGNIATASACVTVPHDQGGGAFASDGFVPDGTAFAPDAMTYVVLVPSFHEERGFVDVETLDPGQAAVGNHFGQVTAARFWTDDFDRDGAPDLFLEFPVDPTIELSQLAPVGLRYAHFEGPGYRINDIFALGARVAIRHNGERNRGDLVKPSGGPNASAVRTTRLISVSPNPFNPMTTISFELASQRKSQVHVYDSRGRARGYAR